MKVSGRPVSYKTMSSNAFIAATDDGIGLDMQVEPERDEATISYTSVWVTAHGKIARGMEKDKSYTIDVELTPEEIARAFIALPPQVVGDAVRNAIAGCDAKLASIVEYRETIDRHSEGLINSSDALETLHAMLDALAGLTPNEENTRKKSV